MVTNSHLMAGVTLLIHIYTEMRQQLRRGDWTSESYVSYRVVHVKLSGMLASLTNGCKQWRHSTCPAIYTNVYYRLSYWRHAAHNRLYHVAYLSLSNRILCFPYTDLASDDDIPLAGHTVSRTMNLGDTWRQRAGWIGVRTCIHRTGKMHDWHDNNNGWYQSWLVTSTPRMDMEFTISTNTRHIHGSH